jgi:hypothetical protein
VKQVANTVIYYQLNENETIDRAVLVVNKLIEKIKIDHVIFSVKIDFADERSQLLELSNSPLSKIDFLYINKPFEDEFDSELIKQLSKAEQFVIKYFDEV